MKNVIKGLLNILLVLAPLLASLFSVGAFAAALDCVRTAKYDLATIENLALWFANLLWLVGVAGIDKFLMTSREEVQQA